MVTRFSLSAAAPAAPPHLFSMRARRLRLSQRLRGSPSRGLPPKPSSSAPSATGDGEELSSQMVDVGTRPGEGMPAGRDHCRPPRSEVVRETRERHLLWREDVEGRRGRPPSVMAGERLAGETPRGVPEPRDDEGEEANRRLLTEERRLVFQEERAAVTLPCRGAGGGALGVVILTGAG